MTFVVWEFATNRNWVSVIHGFTESPLFNKYLCRVYGRGMSDGRRFYF